MKERITSPNPKTSILAAIMHWNGMPGNTAIVSRRLVDSGAFTTLEVKKVEVMLEADEELSTNLSNTSAGEVANLYEDGIVRMGTTVSYGDILIGKSKPDPKKAGKEDPLFKALFGDKYGKINTSVTMPFKDSGIIIDIEKTETRVTVYILIKRELRVGDILRDPKGIEFAIADIIETERMPCIEFSSIREICDIVVAPPTTAELITSSYHGAVFAVMHSRTEPLQILLRHDPVKRKTSKWIATGKAASTGYLKLQKVELLREQKADSPKPLTYYACTGQMNEGYKISRQFIKTLADYGLRANLKEMLTAKSDNPWAYMQAVGKIIHGDDYAPVQRPGEEMTGTALREICLLESLGFRVTIANGSLQLDIDPASSLKRVSCAEVKMGESKSGSMPEEYDLAAAALFDPEVFSPDDGHPQSARFGYITLPMPLLDPFNVERMKEFKEALSSDEFTEAVSEHGKSWEEAVHDILSGMNIAPEHTIEHVMVLPLEMRRGSDINWVYKSVLLGIRRLEKFRKMETYSFIIAKEIKGIQENINRLYGLAKGDTKGLLGLLVENNTGLFEKKVIFSAKSIIIADDKLAADECSIPVALALQIFKPSIQRALMDEDHGPKGAGRLVDSAAAEAVRALNGLAPDLCVLLTTADQSRLSAFKVVIDPDCEVVKLNPETIGHLGIQTGSKGKAYIHAPLSTEARAEAQGILFSKEGIKEAADTNALDSSLFLGKSTLIQVANGMHDGSFILSEYDEIVLGIE